MNVLSVLLGVDLKEAAEAQGVCACVAYSMLWFGAFACIHINLISRFAVWMWNLCFPQLHL